MVKFSERKFDKMLSNAKRDQGHFDLKKFDKDLFVTEHFLNGFKALTISTQTPTNIHVIYFHGGAYIQEATKAHRLLIEDICSRGNCKVTFILYPLAPENNAQTAHEIINKFYQLLLKEFPEDKFILMGDSAGGGLALAFLQSLVESNNEIIPQKTILLSPWLDIEMRNPDIDKYVTKDVILNKERLIQCGKIYAEDLPANSPLVSPINGNLDSLGSIKIFVSTHELFYPDCAKLHELISKSNGSKSEIKIYEGMVHDWILLPIDESDRSVKEIVGFIIE
ncbi:MAG: alpha/beta hydrolase [Bacteroidales bacterium]|nr:alpha/beta hydrolase [Bacteroidales bacterium]